MQRSGITKEELKILCVQCIRCKNIVSRMTQNYHQCPPSAPSQDSDDTLDDDPENSLDHIFQSLEYRLDAIGDGDGALNGLTKSEFAELFSVCTSCDRYVMARDGREGHLCFA